jgi:hypothetical protein
MAARGDVAARSRCGALTASGEVCKVAMSNHPLAARCRRTPGRVLGLRSAARFLPNGGPAVAAGAARRNPFSQFLSPPERPPAKADGGRYAPGRSQLKPERSPDSAKRRGGARVNQKRRRGGRRAQGGGS